MDDRMKHEPGFAVSFIYFNGMCISDFIAAQATMHGNKPSRGAEIDAELAQEDAEQMAKKREKTDSMPGKKNEDHTEKSEWKQQIDREEKEAQAQHRDKGRNTHEGQGMEYVTRKTHSSRE
jgi:hypothetical protein